MTVITKPNIRGDRPFPFIFASRNFCLAKYGGKIDWVNSGGSAGVSSSFPVENIIDGNRASYAQFEKVGPKEGGNFINLKIDLSGVTITDERVDMISFQMNPEYANVKFKISSYTDSAYSANEIVHEYSVLKYLSIAAPPDVYDHGVLPRCEYDEIQNGGSSYDTNHLEPEGFEGRNAWIFLAEPIFLSTRKWIKIRLSAPSHNIVGWDGTWDDGLWSNAVDEILETSDPAGTGEGTNNNHIKLFTDTGTGGHQVDQVSGMVVWRPRALKDTYVVSHYHKQTGFSAAALGYRIEILYHDTNGNYIQTNYIYENNGSDAIGVWAPVTHFLNWRSPKDGKYYSGDGSAKHEVPSNAAIYKIRFRLRYDVTENTLEWKIDDLAIYNSTKVPNSDITTYETIGYGGIFLKAGIRRLMDGHIRIHRIGMCQFKFGTSKSKGLKAHISDLSGEAGANPTTLSESQGGKFAIQDFNGNIVSTFIPKGGIKRKRNISIIGKAPFKEAISDLDQLSEPFGVIDPQSDFSDYIIAPGSMTWVAIDAITDVHLRLGTIEFNEAADFYWNGKLVLQET